MSGEDTQYQGDIHIREEEIAAAMVNGSVRTSVGGSLIL